MTKKQLEQREKAFGRSQYVCFVCGKPLISGQMQFAHRIANTETNRKMYGSFFIDHSKNGEMVCSLECNQTMNIGYNTGAVLDLLADILLFEMRRFKNGVTD